MGFKLPRGLRVFKYPVMIFDLVKEILSGFLLLLIFMSFAALVAYQSQYMGEEKQAVTIAVDEELLNRIDDFRLEHGLDNRVEAINKLLDRASMDSEKPTQENSPSEDALESK